MLIRRVPITHLDAVALIEAVQQVYVERYGGPDESPIDPAEFEEPEGAFFVGYDGEQPVATGAWRRRSVPSYDAGPLAEVKRMHVVASHQRRGLARQMLAHLEADAVDHGAVGMVLETGLQQPEAIAFYAAAGYERIEPFGFYRDSPMVVCFGRRLGVPGGGER